MRSTLNECRIANKLYDNLETSASLQLCVDRCPLSHISTSNVALLATAVCMRQGADASGSQGYRFISTCSTEWLLVAYILLFGGLSIFIHTFRRNTHFVILDPSLHNFHRSCVFRQIVISWKHVDIGIILRQKVHHQPKSETKVTSRQECVPLAAFTIAAPQRFKPLYRKVESLPNGSRLRASHHGGQSKVETAFLPSLFSSFKNLPPLADWSMRSSAKFKAIIRPLQYRMFHKYQDQQRTLQISLITCDRTVHFSISTSIDHWN